jgi:hypothetical protein
MVAAGLVDDAGRAYPAGSEVYALTLHLKISNNLTYGQASVPMNLRRLLNEEGDLAAPSMKQFVFPGTGGSGINSNITLSDQKVVFVVPETDKEFIITTGGSSGIFFSVTVQSDGSIKVNKEPTSESG